MAEPQGVTPDSLANSATLKAFADAITAAVRRAPTIEEKRASRLASKLGSGATAGDEPLVIDLQGPLTGSHWAVRELACSGIAALRVPILGAASGLYLVPQTAPVETLNDASKQWNQQSRTIPIPTRLVTTQIGVSTAFAFALMWDVKGYELIVPQGWTIRAIINAALGVAAPGPGALSSGQLYALCSVEQDW